MQYGKDPALVEVVLRESKSVRRMNKGKLITETKHGFVCANSGVDRSNVPGERIVAPLPKDPDFSSKRIRLEIKRLTGCDVAVLVSDTHGRPFREGEINVQKQNNIYFNSVGIFPLHFQCNGVVSGSKK